ncbi:gliding motility-associated C-terminal domain-containing protein [Lishizhenia sp.]|uniref:Ig-like domain-containing protein n=1 Tax=Lishizhenia sp. TaxID=2497594 RepID=UPI00299F327E|nr:gliding motility-associated C-terminal domain-containing protein [Lishizhenia sp.]MDX1445477.1 gliding motility-associated C-terminal domain-containing protein [Lishizhenia sp.]
MKHFFTLNKLQAFCLLVLTLLCTRTGFSQNQFYANSVTDSLALTDYLNTVDGDLTTFGTVTSSSGLALGLGAYDGFIEVEFPSLLPANTTTYVKIATEDDILTPLTGGSLATLLSDVLGIVLAGNQELDIEARNGTSTVLSASTASPGDFSADSLRVVIDSAGSFYLAITPSNAYNRIYISNEMGSLLGLFMTRELEFYDAFYYNGTNACGQAMYTSFDGTGITLDLLNLGGAGVQNPELAIDSDTSTHSTLNFGILDVASTLEQTIYFDGPTNTTDEFRIRLQISSSLVSLGLANNIEIEAKLGATTVFNQNLTSGSLINLNLLDLQNGQPVDVIVDPNTPIDRITVRMTSLLGVDLAQMLYLYGVQKIPAMPTIDPASVNSVTCANDSIQLIANGDPSTLIMKWYDAQEGGNLIGTSASGDPFTIYNIDQDTTFFVAASIPGCPEESQRTPVDVSIIALPTDTNITVTGDGNPYCALDTINIVPSSVIGVDFTWYFDNNKTQPITNGTLGGVYYNVDANGTLTIAGLDDQSSPYSYFVSVVDTVTGCVNGAGDLKEVVINIIDTQAPTTANANQEFCVLDYATIADLQVNESNILWYDAASMGNALATTDTLIDGEIYYASQVGPSCESSNRLAITVQLNDTTPPTTSNSTQEFCKVDYPIISDIQVDQININWYDAAAGGNLLSLSDTLTTGNYYASQVGTTCESSTRLMVSVIVNDTTAPTASLTTQEFCSASSPTIADLVVDQNNVVWYDAAEGGNLLNNTDVLVDGNSYFAAQVGSECESFDRLEIVVGLGVIPPPTTMDPIQEFCVSDYPTVADLQTNETNVIFYDAATGGNLVSNSDTLVNLNFYYAATVGIGCESTTRLMLQAIVNDTTPPTTSSAVQTFCVLDFATIADIQVDQPNVNWYDAPIGGNIYASTDTLVTGDYYASQVGSECESSLRLMVSIVIDDETPPTTANANQEFCIAEYATVADLQTNEPNVVWYDSIEAGNMYNSTDLLVDGLTYYGAKQGAACESSMRLAVVVTLNDTTAPTTANTTQDFCSTSNPTLADVVVDQPNIIWYAAASGGTPLASSTPLVDNTTYYAAQQGTECESSTRLAILVTVGVIPPPTTSSLNQEFCVVEYATVADIQVNEPNVIWYDQASGGTAYSATDTLMDLTTYYGATQATNCESAVRTAITITLNDTTAPTTANANQIFCTVDNPTVADIQVDQPNVNWYDAPMGGNLLATTDALMDGSYYAAQQGSECESSMRLEVVVTVNDTTAPTTLNANQDFCLVDMPTLDDVQVNQSNIVWYDAATNGNALAGNTALSDGATYYAAQVGAFCESSVRLAITVNVNDASTPTTLNADQEFCQSDNPVIANIQVNQSNINWYDASTGGNQLANSDPLMDGVSYYAALVGINCESAVRLQINVTVTDTVAPTTTDANQEFCAVDMPTVADIQVNETGVNWYLSASGGTALNATDALATNTYYGALIVGNCESSSRLMVNVTVNDTTAPTTLMANQSFCQIDMPTLADIQVNQTNIVWYDAATNGNALPMNTALMNGATYYAAQLSVDCESSQRLAVNVTVEDEATPTTNNTNQDFCGVDMPTIADIQVNETNVSWYDAATGGNQLSNADALIDGMAYYATLVGTNCESSVRLQVNVTVSDTVAPTTTDANQEFCAVDMPTVADIQVNETGVNWYLSATGGTALNATDALATDTYYGALIVGNCESSTRLMVNVTVNDTTAPTTLMANQTFCAGDNPTLADVQVNQTNIVWYDAATNGNALPMTTALMNGATYYAAQLSVDCESSQRLAVTVAVSNIPAPTTNSTAQTFCSIDNPTIASIQVNQTNVVWMDAGANVLTPSTPLTDGASYFGAQTNGQCTGTNLLAVSVTVTFVPAPTTNDANPEFCANTNPTLADISMNEPNINWYDAPTMGTLLPNGTLLVDGQIYYAANVMNGCESEVRTAVQPSLNITSTPTTSNNNQTFCFSDNPTLADIQVTATQVVWYDQQTGGSVLASGTTLQDGATYYAANVENGCESDQRIAITVHLNGGPTAQIIGTFNDICVADTLTYSTNANMTNYVWTVVDGTIVAGGSSTDNFVEVVWDGSGSGSIQVSYTNTAGCSEYMDTPIQITTGICPDLSIYKTVDNKTPEMYENVEFTITVENTGNVTFTNVLINEQLTNGFEYVSHSTSAGAYDLSTGVWSISTVSPNTSETLVIIAKVIPGSNHWNIAHLIGDYTDDTDPENNVDSVEVDPVDLTVYNQFSPNNDGDNDRFIIDGIEDYPENTVQIFNRYGNLVYQTENYQNDWDGVPNVGGTIGTGNVLPTGTYFYIIKDANSDQQWSGWLYLIK